MKNVRTLVWLLVMTVPSPGMTQPNRLLPSEKAPVPEWARKFPGGGKHGAERRNQEYRREYYKWHLGEGYDYQGSYEESERVTRGGLRTKYYTRYRPNGTVEKEEESTDGPDSGPYQGPEGTNHYYRTRYGEEYRQRGTGRVERTQLSYDDSAGKIFNQGRNGRKVIDRGKPPEEVRKERQQGPAPERKPKAP